ncbi:MAG: hypothetical protein ABI859_08690 [Pseudomonadota bacterium]
MTHQDVNGLRKLRICGFVRALPIDEAVDEPVSVGIAGIGQS